VGGYYVGVPVVIGDGGIQRIVELQLDESEQKSFDHSVSAVKELVAAMDKLIG